VISSGITSKKELVQLKPQQANPIGQNQQQIVLTKNQPSKVLSLIDTSPSPSLNVSQTSNNNNQSFSSVKSDASKITQSSQSGKQSGTASVNDRKGPSNGSGANNQAGAQVIGFKAGGSNPRISDEEILDNWIKVEGPAKLKDALNRLKIDLKKLNKKDLEKMTFEQLLSEKKKVKNELKYYDSCFQSAFNRFPVRTEKEPMRDLYVYYKKLKQYLTEAEKREKDKKKESSNTVANNK
jgi:hypothetical protein